MYCHSFGSMVLKYNFVWLDFIYNQACNFWLLSFGVTPYKMFLSVEEKISEEHYYFVKVKPFRKKSSIFKIFIIHVHVQCMILF